MKVQWEPTYANCDFYLEERTFALCPMRKSTWSQQVPNYIHLWKWQCRSHCFRCRWDCSVMTILRRIQSDCYPLVSTMKLFTSVFTQKVTHATQAFPKKLNEITPNGSAQSEPHKHFHKCSCIFSSWKQKSESTAALQPDFQEKLKGTQSMVMLSHTNTSPEMELLEKSCTVLT